MFALEPASGQELQQLAHALLPAMAHGGAQPPPEISGLDCALRAVEAPLAFDSKPTVAATAGALLMQLPAMVKKTPFEEGGLHSWLPAAAAILCPWARHGTVKPQSPAWTEAQLVVCTPCLWHLGPVDLLPRKLPLDGLVAGGHSIH